jgi:hypothetical protein
MPGSLANWTRLLANWRLARPANACSLECLDSQHNQGWVNAIFDLLISQSIEQGGYYDNTLNMMALIAMSGNWWTPI